MKKRISIAGLTSLLALMAVYGSAVSSAAGTEVEISEEATYGETTTFEANVVSVDVIKKPSNTCYESAYFYHDMLGLELRIKYDDGTETNVVVTEENIIYYGSYTQEMAYRIPVYEDYLYIYRDDEIYYATYMGLSCEIICASETVPINIEKVILEKSEDIKNGATLYIEHDDGEEEILNWEYKDGEYSELWGLTEKGMLLLYDFSSMYDYEYFLYLGNQCEIVEKSSNYSLSDIDQNGNIDSDDAIYLLYHSLLPEEYPLSEACEPDFNGDATVDSDDAIYLLYHTLLPEEYPLKNS